MEGNVERIRKDNTFFESNDTCPTCRQGIEESFKKDTIDSNEKKIAELDDGLNTIEKQIDDCLTEINKVDEALKRINDHRILLSSCKTSHNNLLDNLRQIVEQIESFSVSDKTTQDSERQLETVEHDISGLQAEKETLLDDRQYIDLATTLLKDGGIKTKIIKQYLPIINKHINKYLAKLGFFVNFNINESFEESIKSRYRDEFSYNNFSEGEKLRIDLAILLTWRQIAKMKNSVNVNILVFDEILDRAMDGAGTDEFIKIMWEMGDKGTNIFVISHKDSMVDRFQRTVKFEKVKNFSTLTKDQ
jgi:DNA repair exonuclease SbcCD ATPase subunit